MTYPARSVTVPAALRAHGNGRLPDSMLSKIRAGGRLYTPVAAIFDRLDAKALAAGYQLQTVGDYRSLDAQIALFRRRYDLNDLGRIPRVTRQYEGRTWYLRPGHAPSAAPDPSGRRGSNHGWGMAVDIGQRVDGKLVALTDSCFSWLCANAPTFEFYLQTGDPRSPEFERWHWQYGGLLDERTPISSPHYPGTAIRLGARGAAVRQIQAVVGAVIDGSYGPRTEDAVKRWQASRGLVADGIVGPITWAALFA